MEQRKESFNPLENIDSLCAENIHDERLVSAVMQALHTAERLDDELQYVRINEIYQKANEIDEPHRVGVKAQLIDAALSVPGATQSQSLILHKLRFDALLEDYQTLSHGDYPSDQAVRLLPNAQLELVTQTRMIFEGIYGVVSQEYRNKCMQQLRQEGIDFRP